LSEEEWFFLVFKGGGKEYGCHMKKGLEMTIIQKGEAEVENKK